MKSIFNIANGRLEVEEQDIEKLAYKYGTPLYIYSDRSIRERLRILQNNFKGFDVFYSLKTNPNTNIVKAIKRHGGYADTASIGEVELAIKSGFSKEEIIYSSPGKTESDINKALDNCIIIADSLNEIELVNACCENKGIVQKIGIRINPNYSINANAAQEVMSGFPSKFGIDEELVPVSMQRISACKNISINGIQIYMGSQITDDEVIYQNFLNILNVAKNMENIGFNIEFIDFGGGFGIKHNEKERDLDVEKAANRVLQLLDSKEYSTMKSKRLIIESGRFICGPSGVFVSRVVDTKVSRNKNYAIVDGGMNTFFRPVFVKENRYPITIAGKADVKDLEKVTVAGIMCTPIDVFEEDVMLPKIHKGDIIVMENAGAYGYTMSLTKFISHKDTKEIFVNTDGTIL